MFESQEKMATVIFIKPDITAELGEIERTADVFSPKDRKVFVDKFLKATENGYLHELTEKEWGSIENTDSYDLGTGDWDQVDYHVKGAGGNRDWQMIRRKMENKEEIDAPIVLKTKTNYYLVSGNTRLMVSRALGVLPTVFVVELLDY